MQPKHETPQDQLMAPHTIEAKRHSETCITLRYGVDIFEWLYVGGGFREVSPLLRFEFLCFSLGGNASVLFAILSQFHFCRAIQGKCVSRLLSCVLVRDGSTPQRRTNLFDG